MLNPNSVTLLSLCSNYPYLLHYFTHFTVTEEDHGKWNIMHRIKGCAVIETKWMNIFQEHQNLILGALMIFCPLQECNTFLYHETLKTLAFPDNRIRCMAHLWYRMQLSRTDSSHITSYTPCHLGWRIVFSVECLFQ